MKNRTWGLALSYINTFLNMICGLFLSSFLLRQLGDTEYGIYQTMASFVNYLILLEFGTGTVMARNLSQCRARNDSKLEIQRNIATIWGITNILAIAILIISVGFYISLDFVYASSLTVEQIASGKQMFVFLIAILVLNFYAQTVNGIALAYEEYTYSSKVAISRNVLRTVALIVFVTVFKKALIIVLIDAIVNLTIVLYGIRFCSKKLDVKIGIKGFDKLILKSSLPLCLALFLQTVVNQANSTVGKFILGVMSGPEDVSLYSVGVYIYTTFSSLTTIPISLYLPQVTKDIMAGFEGKELTKKLVQPCRLIVIIGGSVLFGFLAIGRQFITIVYGQKYILAWAIAIILMVPMFINMSNAVVLNVLDVKNKRLARSLIMMITTVLNIFMAIYLINKIGIVGSAVSTAVSTAIQVVLLNIYYSKVIKIKVGYLFFNVYKGVLIYQVLGSIIAYLISVLVSNMYLSFVVGGIIYVFVAFGGFVLLGKNPSEKEIIDKFFTKFKRKIGRG